MAWNLLELHKTNPRNRLDGSADSFFILWGNFRKSWQVVCKSRGIAGKVPRNRWKLRQNREKVPRNFLELPRFFQMVPQDVQGVPRNGVELPPRGVRAWAIRVRFAAMPPACPVP